MAFMAVMRTARARRNLHYNLPTLGSAIVGSAFPPGSAFPAPVRPGVVAFLPRIRRRALCDEYIRMPFRARIWAGVRPLSTAAPKEASKEEDYESKLLSNLARWVVCLTYPASAEGGPCDIFVVGVQHYSVVSSWEAWAVISHIKPESVFLELSGDRLNLLEEPTCEMYGAYNTAKEYGCRVVFGDLSEEEIMSKTFEKLTVAEGRRFTDLLSSTQKYPLKEFPQLYDVLVLQRDIHMVQGLNKIAKNNGSIVAIVGNGHLPGIEREWKRLWGNNMAKSLFRMELPLEFDVWNFAGVIAQEYTKPQGITVELDEEMVPNDNEREALQEIVNNTKLSEGYLTLARGIEVMEPKSPEDIYKAHLLDGRASASASVDSARQNLAATFVNAFVNAGFGQGKLMTVQSDSSSGSSGNWLFENKEHGKASAAASLGMILLWEVDSGLAQLDKYFHSNHNHVMAGALLGVGIVNCNIKNDCDPALALLGDYIDKEDASIRIGAIMGLGLAYAGSQNEQIRAKLTPILNDARAPLDVLACTAISLGFIYVGSCNEDVAQSIIFTLMDRSESELGEPLAGLLPLGLGLLYLGKQKNVEVTAEVGKTFNEKIRKHCDMTLLSCAYAGTGNVLKLPNILGHCAQHLEKGKTHQAPAVLGIAVVAMAEELGVEMAIHSLEHLLQYGEQNMRRAVPLALGLLCIANPKVNVMDTLSRLSHDTDSEVAMAAVISLGLIGAGTNNARIAGMLRNLSSYYYKDASLLFCVWIAQGLVHLGKGLLTLNPYHSERFLLSPRGCC